MMARSRRSNQRPDTVMQDRINQVDETSCTARPDHTVGSKGDSCTAANKRLHSTTSLLVASSVGETWDSSEAGVRSRPVSSIVEVGRHLQSVALRLIVIDPKLRL